MQIYLKRFLFAYLIAMALVGTYFIIRTLFFEAKDIQTKSFGQEVSKETPKKLPEKLKESKEKEKPFMLLPQKK